MKTILIVEDELPISQVLKVYLQKANFDTAQAFNGEEAMKKFHELSPSLVILDVMLPGKNGWDILKEIREENDTPVIMLTALGDVNYRLSGLNGGADDYIAKPFNAEEVIARVQAVLRRSDNNQEKVKKYGGLYIDIKSHRVSLNQVDIDLTPRDLSLLIFMAEHPNQTFTRDQLIEHVWGWEYDGSDRAVDLAIKRLRKALQSWPESEGEIKTLRGLGYQLSVYKK
ncbi:two-component system, OmpR family, response regulator VicR [Cytobacillus horneckiae]|uniref:DNA-binding response regulator n=1 Tax=Cytobacillus horneckiae TaxID=549687 RepID=A0A2N0ZEK5_9BACI|nr:response regulator transcription factor [Cytobacillus horneckiae]MBN6888078.1 response regulator transcription factor [Cytobacillus horneckiae]MCM3176933.1 response regulator transcription factor [Cytobacillus horneckiae]MEC1154633.1 response regulator transcription factor [Cytobacillus horneckiae]MED2938974.1 response regulator transcription factor [Cytobacillus horneckiae]PKG27946.1 DNA-binding response regulator [Cytobacillus horneckiae]